jgi:Ras-related GTP-binding protein C/D
MEFATSSDYVFPVINYHFTSIYQASVYDALSKVVSRLMPCQGALERLLDMLVQVRPSHTALSGHALTHYPQNSNFDKAYLFDLASKLYFATDSTPGDAALHELCTEYTDLHWEMDQIYG